MNNLQVGYIMIGVYCKSLQKRGGQKLYITITFVLLYDIHGTIKHITEDDIGLRVLQVKLFNHGSQSKVELRYDVIDILDTFPILAFIAP